MRTGANPWRRVFIPTARTTSANARDSRRIREMGIQILVVVAALTLVLQNVNINGQSGECKIA